MAKKGSIKVPAEMGQRGLPPGLKTHYRGGKGGGIVVPAEMGDQGKPRMNPPGGRGPAPLD